MMPSLMIDHLSINLRSGTDNLVSEISFAIKEGESLILLGQSGSGKTMTCSAVLNLLDPKKFKVSGSVFFGETDLLNSSEKQRRGIYGNQIVYIPQNPMTALDPSMRIGRQMDETLRLHSDKSRQQRYNYILRLLHDVGLDDPDRVYRAYPHMLSGGMLQRVIIAMAMMLDRRIPCGLSESVQCGFLRFRMAALPQAWGLPHRHYAECGVSAGQRAGQHHALQLRNADSAESGTQRPGEAGGAFEHLPGADQLYHQRTGRLRPAALWRRTGALQKSVSEGYGTVPPDDHETGREHYCRR